MKKRLAMLFALCLMTGVLSSCGKDTSSTETTQKDDNTLVILNYGKYIDELNVVINDIKESIKYQHRMKFNRSGESFDFP